MVHIRAVSILYWSTNRARWILTASTFSVMLLAVLLSVSTSTVEARETDPTERIPMEATDPAAEDPPALHPADAAAAWAGESWVQSAILTADDGVEDDRFGGAVAMDGEIIVVGAPTKNESRGAAYVFTRPAAGGEAVQVAKLVASDAKPSARYRQQRRQRRFPRWQCAGGFPARRSR